MHNSVTCPSVRCMWRGQCTRVPSHFRSICAISTVDSMAVGTYHFRKLGADSRVWHGCLHGDAFWRWGLGLVLRVGLSKKLDPTLNTTPAEYVVNKIIKIRLWWPLALILMVSWGSEVGDFASMLGLASGSGTLGFMRAGPKLQYWPTTFAISVTWWHLVFNCAY